MTERSRAWRRRKARVIVAKVTETTNWLIQQFKGVKPQHMAPPLKALKQHRHGKLTHVQDLRQNWALNHQLREEF